MIAVVKKMPLANSVLLVIVHFFIIAGFFEFILYAAPAIYNATEFILPISVYVISKAILPVELKWKRYFTFVVFATFFAGSLFFVRSVILFVHYKMDGKDFDHAQPLANAIAAKYPEFYTTNSLWSLFDNLNGIKIFNGSNVKKGDIIFVQQVNHPFPPELINKCTIVYDWTTADEEKFAGIPLADHPQGYGFVVCRVN